MSRRCRVEDDVIKVLGIIGQQRGKLIKRSDFGVMYGIPIVSDNVKLDISVAFEKVS